MYIRKPIDKQTNKKAREIDDRKIDRQVVKKDRQTKYIDFMIDRSNRQDTMIL